MLGQECSDATYGSYDTVDEAKIACSSIDHCKGVYDVTCNGEDPIYLCPRGSEFEESDWESCVYQRGMLTSIKVPIFILVLSKTKSI